MLYSLLLLTAALFSVSRACPAACTCTGPRLDCAKRGLTTTPRSIPNIIKHVDLRGNDIDFLNGTAFENAPGVISIDASDNRIRNVDPSIFQLANLSILILRKNRLSSIPTSFPLLEKLDLSSNTLSSLSAADLRVLSAVRSVDLSRNHITSIETATSPPRSRLQRLDLASNLLRDLPAGAFAVFPLITSLRLHRNKIAKIDKNTFKALSKLESLDLTRNHLKEVSSLTFDSLSSLIDLSLSRNSISSLEDGVFFGCDRLTSLNLSSNKIATVSDGWLFGLNQLNTLDLADNRIVSFDPVVWGQCPNLRLLSLHGNRLIGLPSGAFRLLPRLEHLLLSGNAIRSLHKTSMTGLDRLKSLDLSSNTLAVCVEDGAVLYNTSMPYLKSLKFASNQLKVVPSRAFARFPALDELDLSDNPIATLYPGAFEPLRLRKLVLSTTSVLCDCHMSWFAGWLYASRLDRSLVAASCIHPPALRGIPVITIDQRNLTCVDDSPRARVTVHPQSIVRSFVHGTASFECHGYGHQPLTIEWRIVENGKPRVLSPDTTTSIFINKTTVFNGTATGQELLKSRLELRDVVLSDRAEYQCAVSNEFAKDYSIRAQLEVHQSPLFVREPDDMSLLVGQNAKIMCSATGVPAPVLRWSKDGGDAFPAATQRRLHVRPNDDHLYVLNVTREDQGVYTCHAANDAGDVQASATLRVFENVFRSPLLDVQVLEGDTVVLDCLADITPTQQRIEWKKNENILKAEGIKTQLKANQQILLLSKVSSADSGRYSCELWAGNDLLARQSATVDVQTLEQRENVRTAEVQTDKRSERGRRWLTVSLSVIVLGFIIFGLSWSIVYFRRSLLLRKEIRPAHV